MRSEGWHSTSGREKERMRERTDPSSMESWMFSTGMVFIMSITLSTKFFYKDVLERLRKRIIRLRPVIADKCMLHHDNAVCHTALSVTEFFTSKGIPVVPLPPFTFSKTPRMSLSAQMTSHLRLTQMHTKNKHVIHYKTWQL